MFRELDRKRGNASSACGDEHLVAGLEVRTFLQRLPRRQPDHRDGGCLHEVQIRRFECGNFFGHDRKLSESARAQPEDAGEDSIARLETRNAMLWAVSRAPLAKLQAYKRRMGWSFPWASSSGSDFNYDFNVSFTEEQQRSGNIEYNYRKSGVSSRKDAVAESEAAPDSGAAKLAAGVGVDWATFTREAPGMSAFALEDGVVYHTYSAYARGLDGLWAAYQWLDRAPKGRNETGLWFRRSDEYDKGASKDCCACAPTNTDRVAQDRVPGLVGQ